MQIPFNNLRTQYNSIQRELDEAVLNALHSFNFIKGKEILMFENQFSKLLLSNHCIATGNGTSSILISLKALNIKSGDEVITPAHSWISSSETISLCGATPVFVDVDPKSYTLNPTLIEDKITSRTKAIVVVHLYGQAAHINEIKSLCQKHNLYLIEDCAQAHLTAEGDKYVGTFGDAAAFSFYPTKNLGAYGDAGCILTNNDELAEKMRRFANHGALQKDDHLVEGMNSRMDTLQSAVLLAKLSYLKQWNQQRIENAKLYTALLSEVSEISLPFVRPGTQHTFHLFVIRARQRDRLQSYLGENGIQTLIHYPKALPNLPAYKYLNHKPEDFPVASALQNEVLSLPIYPELKREEIYYISDTIKKFMLQSNQGLMYSITK